MTTFELTPHESVTIRRSAPEALEVEVVYAPGGGPPPKHLHPEQEERFEVLAGELRARVDGEERSLGPGDTLEVARGAPHQMWNPGDAETRALWVTRPRGRTDRWFEALDRLQREGRVGKDGMPGPLAFGVLLTEYRDVFRLAVGPDPVVRTAMRGLGAIGRRRGYRP